MNGTEYSKAIARLDLTQVEAARFLGVDDTTSRRWVADRSPIPRAVAMLLRLMIRYRLSPDHVSALTLRKIRT
jgi:transposase-like protein